MITNVTTVFVGNGAGVFSGEKIPTAEKKNAISEDAEKYIVMDVDKGTMGVTEDTTRFKIGQITKTNTAIIDPETKQLAYTPVVKWSNIITKDSVITCNKFTYFEDTEDTVQVTFVDNGVEMKRILLRVTYKDIVGARYRKWTETYEYVAKPNETAAKIAEGMYNELTKNYKRNRFNASISTDTITLEAMEYDDYNFGDAQNRNEYGKVRFDVHVYYTLPNADGFASKNKYQYEGTVEKIVVGETYKANTKLVHDREMWALGYEGITVRGEGTDPIIAPKSNVVEGNEYDGMTIEFWRDYRAADDIVRKTRETVEIYDTNITEIATVFDETLGITPVSTDKA